MKRLLRTALALVTVASLPLSTTHALSLQDQVSINTRVWIPIQLQTSFSGIEFAGYAGGRILVLQSGPIVEGGSNAPTRLQLWNLGTQIVYTATPTGGQSIKLSTVALMPDGRVLYLMNTPENSSRQRIGVLGLNGVLERSFSLDGSTGGSFVSQQPLVAAQLSDGRFVLASPLSDTSDRSVIRIFPVGGGVPVSFRVDGLLAPTLEGGVWSLAIAKDLDGSDLICVVEKEQTGQVGQFIKQFKPNGQLVRIQSLGRSFLGSFGANFVITPRLVLGIDAPSFPVTSRGVVDGFPGSSYYLDGSFISGLSRLVAIDGDKLIAARTVIDGSNRRVAVLIDVLDMSYKSLGSSSRNSLPNPLVMRVQQRSGQSLLDIDYRVDDSNDPTVETGLIAFTNGIVNLQNFVALRSFAEGTGSKVGTGVAANANHRVTWNVANDWNVDFGNLRLMALARDSRQFWFDGEFVELPADGARPAVKITRHPIWNEEFFVQILWLLAKNDPTVRIETGSVFAVGGAFNGQQLASGNAVTDAGRRFLLARDGLRLATNAEVDRAVQGSTPGFVVQQTPKIDSVLFGAQSRRWPNAVNEFGIDSSGGTSSRTPGIGPGPGPGETYYAVIATP